jgi:hypothetical protein
LVGSFVENGLSKKELQAWYNELKSKEAKNAEKMLGAYMKSL